MLHLQATALQIGLGTPTVPLVPFAVMCGNVRGAVLAVATGRTRGGGPRREFEV